MKRHLFLTGLPLMAATLAFTACGGDDITDIPEVPDVQIEGPSIDNKTPLTPEEQKEYLEAVAEAFMDLTPADDFRDLADLANYCYEEFEDYDWDDVEDWAEDAWNALLVKKNVETVENHDEYHDSYYNEYYDYTDVYQNYDALIAVSNFTGHFEDRGGYWKVTKADDLQFSFKDERGKQVVATLTAKGGKEVNIGHYDDWTDSDGYDYYHDDNGYHYQGTSYYDRFNTTIKVPNQIDVTLTQDGTTLVHTVVNIDLSSLSSNSFVNSSSVSITQQTDFNNGYKVQLSQAKYSSGKSAACTFALSNKSGNLFTAAIGADIKNLPQFNSSTFDEDDYDDDDLDDVDGSINQIAIDVLGKVQIKGSLSDVSKFANYINEVDDYDCNDRANIMNAISNANKLLNLGIYYDGKNVRQAYVTLESIPDEYWDGEVCYHDIMPVLNFEDGSSYDTFEAFFNDRDFSSAIRTFKRLANRYADLIDEVERPF